MQVTLARGEGAAGAASVAHPFDVVTSRAQGRYTQQAMRPGARFPVGKLPPSVLQALLACCPLPKSSDVVIGPRFGEDAAVIDFGSKYLVAKTDPITFTAERIGWYAVNINANDVATLGARPVGSWRRSYFQSVARLRH